MLSVPHSVVDNQLFLCSPALFGIHIMFSLLMGLLFFKQHLKIPTDTSNVLGAHETVA